MSGVVPVLVRGQDSLWVTSYSIRHLGFLDGTKVGRVHQEVASSLPVQDYVCQIILEEGHRDDLNSSIIEEVLLDSLSCCVQAVRVHAVCSHSVDLPLNNASAGAGAINAIPNGKQSVSHIYLSL